MPGSLSGVLMSCAIYFHRRNVFMHHPLNWIPWKSSFNGQLGVPQSWAYIGISHREPMLGSGYIQTWNTAHVNSNKISKSSTCTHYPTQYVIVHVLSNTHTYIYQICIYRYKKHQICFKKKLPFQLVWLVHLSNLSLLKGTDAVMPCCFRHPQCVPRWSPNHRSAARQRRGARIEVDSPQTTIRKKWQANWNLFFKRTHVFLVRKRTSIRKITPWIHIKTEQKSRVWF